MDPTKPMDFAFPSARASGSHPPCWIFTRNFLEIKMFPILLPCPHMDSWNDGPNKASWWSTMSWRYKKQRRIATRIRGGNKWRMKSFVPWIDDMLTLASFCCGEFLPRKKLPRRWEAHPISGSMSFCAVRIQALWGRPKPVRRSWGANVLVRPMRRWGTLGTTKSTGEWMGLFHK